jgi:integrase
VVELQDRPPRRRDPTLGQWIPPQCWICCYASRTARLAGKPFLTRRNWRRDLGILFAYAAKQGYAVSNPIERIERPEISDSEVNVLSVPEASKLLINANEDVRPILVIGLFAGLRVSELLALHWEEVDLCDRTITVQGRKGKTRQWRVVTQQILSSLPPLIKLSAHICQIPLREPDSA